jgi:hypothetical protein
LRLVRVGVFKAGYVLSNKALREAWREKREQRNTNSTNKIEILSKEARSQHDAPKSFFNLEAANDFNHIAHHFLGMGTSWVLFWSE